MASACSGVAFFGIPSRANAHAIGLSTGDYAASGDSLAVKIAFARSELAILLPSLDDDGDGHVTAREVESARKELGSKVLSRVVVTSNGGPCAASLLGAALTDADGLVLEARFDCPPVAGRREAPLERQIDVDVALLSDLPTGHRHVARVVGPTTRDEVLFRGSSSFAVISPPALVALVAESPPSNEQQVPPVSHLKSAWGFFKMGIEHILTGYDHLVFLFGLVLLRARLRELLAVVSAFTLAHSMTLALAVLGLFSPSPKFVEPAIALSIAYVGIENFFVKDASKRWRITFPFGLIHGFGFAGALQEAHLPRALIPTALVAFNLGVESGQLFALAIVLPAIRLLRTHKGFEPQGVRVLSAIVALAGGTWFVLRVVQSG